MTDDERDDPRYANWGEAVMRSSMTDGVLRMEAERKAVVESLATHCPACKVPWGDHGCTHAFPTAEKLMASIDRIAADAYREERHVIDYFRKLEGLGPISDGDFETVRRVWLKAS